MNHEPDQELPLVPLVPLLPLACGLAIALTTASAGCSDSSEVFVDQPITLTQELPARFRDGADDLIAEFKIRNPLNSQIRIESIDTSCGCSSAVVASRELDGGEETVLRVAADIRRKRGAVRLTTVLTADTGHRWTCVLKTNVYPRLLVSLDRFSFGSVLPGESKQVDAEVLTWSESGAPPKPDIHLTGDSKNVDFSQFTSTVEEVESGFKLRRTPLTVTLQNPVEATGGQMNCKLVAKAPDFHKSVPVSWSVASQYETSPRRLFFGAVDSESSAITRTLEIRHRSGEAFQIHSVEASQDAYTVSAISPAAASEHRVQVTVQPGEIDKFALGTLTLELVASVRSKVTVPLAAIISSKTPAAGGNVSSE